MEPAILGVSPLAEIGVRDAIAVREGPAVEPALFDAVELTGWKIVAQQVAPVVGRKQLARTGSPVEAHRVAQPGGEDLCLGAVGPEAEQRGPARVLLEAYVAGRTHGEVHEVVGAEADRSGPVIPARRKPRHHGLDDPLHSPRGCVEAHTPDRIELGHVEPALVQVHPVRAIELLEKDLGAVRASRHRSRRGAAGRPASPAARSREDRRRR